MQDILEVLLKGGAHDGRSVGAVETTRTMVADGQTYKRTGEVIGGVAVFRWEGEL